jgi:type IX secretion system PorP/SprF family membrane protein
MKFISNYNMRTIALFMVISLASVVLRAQQDPQYSMHYLNGMAIHPGYAGSLGGVSANVLYRNQWTGLTGAPKTFSANAQMRYFKDQLGTGLVFFNDQIGVFSRNAVNVAQAYHVRLDELTVSFGLQASFQQFSGNLTATKPVEAGDQAFAANVSKSILNFGSGVYAYSDKFWFGFSIPYFLKSKWSNGVESVDPYLTNHMFISGGGILRAGAFQFKPSMLVKKSYQSPYSIEAGCTVYAFSTFGLGANYRFGDALEFIGEFQIDDNLRLAYGFERTVSSLQAFNNGTHEIMLRYHFNNGGKAVTSPRLF